MSTCDPNAGQVEACTLSERLMDTDYVTKSMLQWEHLIFIAYTVIFLVLARYTYQFKLFFFLRSRKDVEGYTLRDGFRKAMTDDDNKALAVSFSGYLLATGLILWASMTDLKRGSDQQVLNLTSIVVYQLLGVLFLEIARVVNDKLLLRKIDNNYALIVKHNVAVGCAEAGSYVGTGLIVMGAISGPVTSWGNDLATSCLFFVLGQLAFISFAYIVNTRFVTRFDFYKEIEGENVAAGLLLGLEFIAVGYLMSNSTVKSDSLLTYVVWYVLGGLFLVLSRFFVDFVIIPGQELNLEIKRDRNIGAAFLVGGLQIAIVHVLNTFLPDSCQNPT